MKSPRVHPVHDAVRRHSLAEVTQAIEQGEDVDALDREGRTPLFYAAQDGNIEIATELIRHGANVNFEDKGHKTPLHFAASACQPQVAELLLENGASIDVQDAHGNTPLFDAVFGSRGRGEMIRLLLSAGANRARKNKHGVSPEDLAKSIGNYDVNQFFLA